RWGRAESAHLSAAPDLAVTGLSRAPDCPGRTTAADLAKPGLSVPPDCSGGTATGDLAKPGLSLAADLLAAGHLGTTDDAAGILGWGDGTRGDSAPSGWWGRRRGRRRARAADGRPSRAGGGLRAVLVPRLRLGTRPCLRTDRSEPAAHASHRSRGTRGPALAAADRTGAVTRSPSPASGPGPRLRG